MRFNLTASKEFALHIDRYDKPAPAQAGRVDLHQINDPPDGFGIRCHRLAERIITIRQRLV